MPEIKVSKTDGQCNVTRNSFICDLKDIIFNYGNDKNGKYSIYYKSVCGKELMIEERFVILQKGYSLLSISPLWINKSNVEGTQLTLEYDDIMENKNLVINLYTTNKDIVYHPFRQNLFNIEHILKSYDEAMEKNYKKKDETSINKSLEYAINFIKRRMIVFIITDIVGLEEIDEDLLKTLSFRNDVMVISIKDIDLFEKKSYDLEKRRYFAPMLLHKKKLAKLEKEEKEKVFAEGEKKLIRNKASLIVIENSEEIVPKIVELLEKNRNMDL